MIKYPSPFIIAEIGNNHEGSLINAKKLVIEAAKSGVSAVKFQTYLTESYIHPSEKKRFKMLKKFELKRKDFIKLSKFTKQQGLKFISTPLDIDSAIFLSKIVDIFKISSGDNNFYELIKIVSKFKKQLIISLGLINENEILKLIKYVKAIGYLKKTSFLHCVSSYPVDKKDINLLSIRFIKEKFKVNTGYSDHSIGIDAAVNSYLLGADIIEKHFTLNHNFSKFRDHKLSANPAEMRLLVRKINDLKLMLGYYNKKITKNELMNLKSMRRSVYSKITIKKGERISLNKINFLRPKNKKSLPIKRVINKLAKKKIMPNSPIKITDIY
tara:strand:- start:467 stop:1447 length:981 start_codon:yes stop_codon:yes gene_type:complete